MLAKRFRITGERLSFLTNIWQITAMDIARIYRHRRDIEAAAVPLNN